MSHTQQPSKVDHNQQIADLQNLHPRAASWLAGMPYSTFRDNAHKFNPNADGSFNAHDVAVHTQSDEVKLSDEEAEMVRKAAASIDERDAYVVIEAIRILERFGSAGGAYLLEELKIALPDVRAPEYLTAGAARRQFEDGLDARLAADKSNVANRLGHWVYQCPSCSKYRAGRKWVKRNPNPAYEVERLECDGCYVEPKGC